MALTPEQREQLIEDRRRRLDARKAAAAEKAARAIEDAELLDAPIEEMESPAEAEPVAVQDDPAAERRKRLLADIDPETASLISDEELEKIDLEEREKALAEQKKQALANVRAAARQQARVEYDLIPGDVLRSDAERRRLNENVTFRIDVPGDGAGHRGRSGIRIDGFLYEQGRTYTRPRGVFESLQEMHYRVHLAEVRFRTHDQHQRGRSAEEVLGRTAPRFEVTA